MSNAEALKYVEPSIKVPEKEAAVEEKLVFQPGAIVIAGSNNNEGTLIQLVKKGQWSVQFGSVKMTMKEKDLTLVSNGRTTAYTPTITIDSSIQSAAGGYVIEKDAPKPVFELRLLGMYGEEAFKALERQIDLCILNNFLHFSVIHGKGDGVLQQVVRDYLSHCPAVQDFSFAPAEDGGTGKTYVSLK